MENIILNNEKGIKSFLFFAPHNEQDAINTVFVIRELSYVFNVCHTDPIRIEKSCNNVDGFKSKWQMILRGTKEEIKSFMLEAKRIVQEC